MNKKKCIAWGVVLVWMGIIFYLSHQPATSSSQLSEGVMSVVIKGVETAVPILDLSSSGLLHDFIRKAAHFFAYFVLGVFVYHAIRVHKQNRLQVVLSLVICITYAVSDEFHQLFIPGRSGEVRDVLIDGAGSFTGIMLYKLVRSKFWRNDSYNN